MAHPHKLERRRGRPWEGAALLIQRSPQRSHVDSRVKQLQAQQRPCCLAEVCLPPVPHSMLQAGAARTPGKPKGQAQQQPGVDAAQDELGAVQAAQLQAGSCRGEGGRQEGWSLVQSVRFLPQQLPACLLQEKAAARTRQHVAALTSPSFW